uniref:Uncharacterized protein n=1 Tax=Caenorhabditis tropicalis TaxID=1561998 RepID=A0A1I7SZ87_9PELO
MIPRFKKRIQTSVEKHFAAPAVRKHRNRRHAPSPLIPCPNVGIVYNSQRFEEPPRRIPRHTYGFRPKEHAIFEEEQNLLNETKRSLLEEDMEQINLLLPIDILLRSIQEQSEKIEKPADPIPLRIKVSPQFRRIKIKKTRKRSKKMRTPERGQLIQPIFKWLTLERILILQPQPKLITLKMFTSILGVKDGIPRVQISEEFIAQQRSVLYHEEGAKWIKIFLPGASDDDPTIPSIYRIFDNTDDGIPDIYFNQKDENMSPKTLYQFRVVAKRFSMKLDADQQEMFLLTQILGMSKEEINFLILRFALEEAIHEKSHQDLQEMVLSAFKESFDMDLGNEECFKKMVNSYEDNMMPILNSLLQSNPQEIVAE